MRAFSRPSINILGRFIKSCLPTWTAWSGGSSSSSRRQPNRRASSIRGSWWLVAERPISRPPRPEHRVAQTAARRITRRGGSNVAGGARRRPPCLSIRSSRRPGATRRERAAPSDTWQCSRGFGKLGRDCMREPLPLAVSDRVATLRLRWFLSSEIAASARTEARQRAVQPARFSWFMRAAMFAQQCA